tara:strand:- start:23576 stop:24655 length:1080 start_codon:yes stop_codon:yes gene_type:complete
MNPRIRRSKSLFVGAALLATAACSASSSNGGAATQSEVAPEVSAAQGIDAGASANAKTVDSSRVPETGPARAPKAGFVGADDLIARDVIKFATPAEASAYDKLEACFVRYGEEWTAYPRRRFGNFVNVEWCRGQGSNINCGGGNTRETPGAGWGSLSVLQYEREWPQVFGLSFTTGQIPTDNGVAVSFSWSEGGKSVLGESVHATFKEVVAGEVGSKLSLGMAQGFSIGEGEIKSPTKGTRAELYQRLVASPDSLRNEAKAQLDGLEAAVEAALTADTPRKCVYGKYQGGGIPPRCLRKVPLDASEKAAARASLQEILTSQRALITKHADAMHAGLVELLPSECWTPQTTLAQAAPVTK